MKKLKYRIWDEDNGEFLGYEAYILLDQMGGLWEWNMAYEDAPHPIECKVCVEQFTGLRDKNGKEIFEGDILKLAGFGGVFRVRYVKAHAMFIAEQIENDYSDARAVPFSDLARDEMVIVGNIHENMDLLK